MLLGEGIRKYSYDTDNVLDFIMSLVCDHWLGVLKLANFFEWTNPHKIGQMLHKNRDFFLSTPNHRKPTFLNKVNCQCQFLILKHPKPKGRI